LLNDGLLEALKRLDGELMYLPIIALPRGKLRVS